MMRTALPRALRPAALPTSGSSRRWASSAANLRNSAAVRSQSAQLKTFCRPSLALTAQRPCFALSRRYASAVSNNSGAVPGTYRDPAKEIEYSKILLSATPDVVSTSSSVTPVATEGGQEKDEEMMAGMRHDVEVIKETFALDQVPKEALNIGLAGVVPYVATSVATVGCAVEIHQASVTGSGYFLSGQTAESVLAILEPLQVGYGAVILSFLGAIHWGLEWAGFGGHQGYRRYAIGVIAPAVAWPTILMPVEQALTTQFLAFSMLYSIDSGASVRGWVPEWYATYRFVLTFIVGASIVISLIGRGQISDRIGSNPATTDRILALRKATQVEEEETSDLAEVAEGEEAE